MSLTVRIISSYICSQEWYIFLGILNNIIFQFFYCRSLLIQEAKQSSSKTYYISKLIRNLGLESVFLRSSHDSSSKFTDKNSVCTKDCIPSTYHIKPKSQSLKVNVLKTGEFTIEKLFTLELYFSTQTSLIIGLIIFHFHYSMSLIMKRSYFHVSLFEAKYRTQGT